jgi:hypothetical protein
VTLHASWEVDLTPADCPGLASLVAAVHAAVAMAPWAAGCATGIAAPLSAVAGLAWWSARRAVPGRAAGIRRLRNEGACWLATLQDGTEQPAKLLAGSRVLARFVFCQVRVAGQKLDWWLPAYAVPATGFRRFKVALRCRQQVAGPALLDSNRSNHEEAARPAPGSRQAN